MPIFATCQCGTKYSFKDSAAGSRAKCPSCGRIIVIPAHVTVEVVDDEPAARRMSPARIVAVCGVGVFALGSGIFVYCYSQNKGKQAESSAPVVAVTPAPSKSIPTAVKPAPAPVKPAVVATPPETVKKEPEPVKPVAPPPITPAELLKPWREQTVLYCILDSTAEVPADKKLSDALQAAENKTVGAWLDWVKMNPTAVPCTAFLQDPVTRVQVLDAYEGRTPAEEKAKLPYDFNKISKVMRVVWLKYGDVQFAVDELRMVVAIRVVSWPTAAADPAKKPAPTAPETNQATPPPAAPK